jgi:hypothetical protein
MLVVPADQLREVMLNQSSDHSKIRANVLAFLLASAVPRDTLKEIRSPDKNGAMPRRTSPPPVNFAKPLNLNTLRKCLLRSLDAGQIRLKL